MPSGQAIAGAMGATALGPDAFGELASYRLGLEASTPLWYYVLKEAEVDNGGLRLGPTGATIVAEVLVGLLAADPSSFLRADPGWEPELPSEVPGQFTVVDFLRFAGVV